ncbi:MAG: hypothetical protein HYY76_08740 [Acidobacteria bacterium]|nr:hypothetical protein [Acidobacteriota bacterium]
MMCSGRTRYGLIAWACLVSATAAVGAELQPRTNRAYGAYLKTATEGFLSRVRAGARASVAREGVLPARPGREDGIIGVPGGLVHDWVGAAFLRDATLEEVLAVSCAYEAYSRIYRAVIASRLLAREADDTYRVQMRLRESEAGISAVLDVRSTVRYVRLTSAHVYTVSDATEIREVKNAGRRDEQLLPPGRDSGYLWRASTFSYFEQRNDGVYIEMETVGLSRRFPSMLGWIIEPIARRVGRRSVERSLAEFLAAVQTRRIAAGACTELTATSAAPRAPAISLGAAS